MSSVSSSSSNPFAASLFYEQVEEKVAEDLATKYEDKIMEELTTMTGRRVQQIQNEFGPRLDFVHDKLENLGKNIGKVREKIKEIKESDEKFIARTNSLEQRMKNINVPNPEMVAINRSITMSIIAHVLSVAVIIAAIATGVLLLILL